MSKHIVTIIESRCEQRSYDFEIEADTVHDAEAKAIELAPYMVFDTFINRSVHYNVANYDNYGNVYLVNGE